MNPKTQRILTLVSLGAAACAAMYFIAREVNRRLGREGSVRPGEVIVQGGDNPCRAVPQWDFHLRPQEREERTGSRNYRSGTELALLRRGSLTRNGATIYEVRVVRDGSVGWCYLFDFEIRGVCRAVESSESGTSAAGNVT